MYKNIKYILIALSLLLMTGCTELVEVLPNSKIHEVETSVEGTQDTGGEENGDTPVDKVETETVKSAVSGLEMKVHFLDVGQGDSILIQSPNGKTMLIDAGIKSQGEKVVNYMNEQGIKELDYMVATHPHADHIGGLLTVMDNLEVHEFVDSGHVHTTNMYYNMLEEIDNKDIKFTVPEIGDVMDFDKDVTVTVMNAGENAKDENGASIVLKIEYGDVSFMMTGDADSSVEKEMMKKFDVKSTYLKAGHHGSNTSSSVEFLNEVKPEGTILSYKENNQYGHPHDEILDRLKAVNSDIYSTSLSGDIVVTTDGVNHGVSKEAQFN